MLHPVLGIFDAYAVSPKTHVSLKTQDPDEDHYLLETLGQECKCRLFSKQMSELPFLLKIFF